MIRGSGAILVGVFGAPQGVRGEIRLKSFTGEPEAIATYGELRSREGRRFRLLAVRRLKNDMLVARVEGVTDRDAARALTDLQLYVDRRALPAAGEDEFYYADLIGLAVEVTDGRGLGVVAGVENYGGGDLLEVRLAAGQTVLVPFTQAFVPIVDLAARRVLVTPAALGADDDEGLER